MVYKLTIFIKKNDKLTDEEFHKYWTQEHPKILFSTKFAHEHILKYSQVHVDRKATDQLLSVGIPMAQFDGYAELYVKINSTEELLAALQNEEYKEVVGPDEEYLTNKEEWMMMWGWTEDIAIKEGVNLEGEQNGRLAI